MPHTWAFLEQIGEQIAAQGLGSLAPIETGLLQALKGDGTRLLEALLNQPGLPVPRQGLEPGEENDGLREVRLLTLLGPLTLRRPYYYNSFLKCGRAPLDDALGLDLNYSPGVAKLMCRAGARSSGFEGASQDLQAYAGLSVSGRQIQRLVMLVGPRLAAARQALPAPVHPRRVDVLCVSVDGTGVPARPEELVDRAGKQPDGSARTREVKLAAVFTHARPAPGERPFRDVDATSYLADIVEAAEFGLPVRREAFRRGMAAALIVVFLGDGAKWVWELARVNFPGAIWILDFFHALEHVAQLIKLLYGDGSDHSKKTFRRWRKALRRNRIGWVIAVAKRDLPASANTPELAQKEIDYFENNRQRMQYQTYLEAGYFIGSGVVEAGCKSVVGQRLKQSGMRWSVMGARQILTIRSAMASGLFDSLWETCHCPTSINKVASSTPPVACHN